MGYVLAQPSAEIVRVECAKRRREISDGIEPTESWGLTLLQNAHLVVKGIGRTTPVVGMPAFCRQHEGWVYLFNREKRVHDLWVGRTYLVGEVTTILRPEI